VAHQGGYVVAWSDGTAVLGDASRAGAGGEESEPAPTSTGT
jgi:hypothetical protein